MCLFHPKTPDIPAPVERQMMQAPKMPNDGASGLNKKFRRGFWANVMTSPQGAPGQVSVTGTPGT
jgi:hypothetical protein